MSGATIPLIPIFSKNDSASDLGEDGGGDEVARGLVISISDDSSLAGRVLGVTILLSLGSDRLHGVSS